MAKTVNAEKTAQILHYIKIYCKANGRGPTLREIGQAVNIKSTSTVADYVSRMERDKLITAVPGIPHSIKICKNDGQSGFGKESKREVTGTIDGPVAGEVLDSLIAVFKNPQTNKAHYVSVEQVKMR